MLLPLQWQRLGHIFYVIHLCMILLVMFLKVKGGDVALNLPFLNGTPISELWSITCRMGSHSVTCHATQVNVPYLKPCQIGWYSIYLPRWDGRLSEPE